MNEMFTKKAFLHEKSYAYYNVTFVYTYIATTGFRKTFTKTLVPIIATLFFGSFHLLPYSKAPEGILNL